MKRALLIVVLVVAVIGAMAAFTAWRSGKELVRAQAAIRAAGIDDPAELVRAREHLRAAHGSLEGPVPALLRLVPVARQNVDALRTIASGLEDALGPAERLAAELRRLGDSNIVEDGRVDVDALMRLQEPLEAEAFALAELERDLEDTRSGWLLPPLYHRSKELAREVSSLGTTADAAADALASIDDLAGVTEPRRYLVILMNNAELRGAGGLASAIGTVAVRDGRIEMESFFYHGDIDDPRPFRRVPAPPDFRRRFSAYKADTTLWSNLTFSSDVPEVAAVGSRLFELVKGRATVGALVLDPVALAALLPPDKPIEIPAIDGSIPARALPRFVYSDAYRDIGGRSAVRRKGLLQAGRNAIEAVFDGGLSLKRLFGEADVIGSHVRFVSFDEQERDILRRLHVSGALVTPEVDASMIASQNFGPDKLDYWIDRAVEHACAVDASEASCTVTTTLANGAPRGLTPFVEGEETPGYARAEAFLETYVPASAAIRSVRVDGEDVPHYRETEDGLASIAVDVEVPRGASVMTSVTYDLSLEGRYELYVRPQPLARDADLRVALDSPPGWTAYGPGAGEEGDVLYEGPFTRTLRFSSAPADPPGITGAWEWLVRFWNEPIFD